ncbi:unnamed protein product [Brachionus calyciflorus]|uniref:Reverse transcriptase RNase H-like domain-containing protein n=1 Tax=Brachionus calyciflorus TaxID=104777 RepID=A0A814KLQ8_9BILA|nr:unnamed protein product [Brachionus calyciflorus]
MFLRYKISPEGVSIDETRTKAIKEYPRPKNTKTSQTVSYPDFSKQFHPSTDASNMGVGAVLSQFDELRREHALFYASRSLKAAERNYSTIERELLGIVYAVEKFRYYLYGTEFVIHTDHNPLRYLQNLTISSSRLTRWRLKLSEYNFTIKYKKGVQNKVADPLSRIEKSKKSQETSSKEDIIEALLSIVEKRDKPINDRIIYNLQFKENFLIRRTERTKIPNNCDIDSLTIDSCGDAVQMYDNSVEFEELILTIDESIKNDGEFKQNKRVYIKIINLMTFTFE